MKRKRTKFFDSTERDPVAVGLGTGFNQFTRKGVSTLAKANGMTLEILAIYSSKPFTGQFREFVAAAKERFDKIILRHVWNVDLVGILDRYGFKLQRNAPSDFWVWKKEP